MSISYASPAIDAAPRSGLVPAPNAADVVSGALRSAFGRRDARAPEFDALLRRIDATDDVRRA